MSEQDDRLGFVARDTCLCDPANEQHREIVHDRDTWTTWGDGHEFDGEGYVPSVHDGIVVGWQLKAEINDKDYRSHMPACGDGYCGVCPVCRAELAVFQDADGKWQPHVRRAGFMRDVAMELAEQFQGYANVTGDMLVKSFGYAVVRVMTRDEQARRVERHARRRDHTGCPRPR